MNLLTGLILAILLDQWLGEPKRGHPLIAFGRYAVWLEHRCFRFRKLAGLLALCLAVMPPTLGVYWLNQQAVFESFLAPLILYLCLGAKSLKQHALAVYQALVNNEPDLARTRVGMIVSRETRTMDELAIRRAAIESVLENGADAVFAALFWFLIAGPAGVVLYRLGNTLDAMWGYKSARYQQFGWATARFDDILNWIPARLTALSYSLLGNFSLAIKCWQEQAGLLESPNGGPVMTAGAGALNLQLGGVAVYQGQIKHKPYFGGSQLPDNRDIIRAIRLLDYTLVFWIVCIIIGANLA